MTKDTYNNEDDQLSNSGDQMQKLIRDHSECILFAEEIMRIADQGTDDELVEGIEKVNRYNIEELEPHLQHEEQTILRDLIQNHQEHSELCITIGKEHGYIRTLVEEMSLETAKKDLAEFGRILKSHTLFEDKELFPLVENLFTQAQMLAIKNFTPFRRHESLNTQPQVSNRQASHDDQKWLSVVEQYYKQAGQFGASIVLFPRYNPDLSLQMAEHLGLELFDFQKEVMEEFGQDADALNLDQLENALRNRAEKAGVVPHNVEALLCVKSEQERRHWLSSFLDTDWPNPVLLPISIFQADVPGKHQKVCDLELQKMPKQTVSSFSAPNNRHKYYIEDRE